MDQQPLYNPTFLNLEYFFVKIANGLSAIWDFLMAGDIFFWVKIIIAILILFFIGVIVYSCIRIFELLEVEEEELEHILHMHETNMKQAAESPVIRNLKWENARDKVFTDNPSDWKLAIIEADTVLDDLLTERGYVGAGIGEKLKEAEKGGGFKSVQKAWEAHTVRNDIAHDNTGGAEISKREAIRVIGLYEQIFEEEGYI